MFAFAIYDRPSDRLYLVRDRLGIKPLYYTQQSDSIVFSSEIRALLASGHLVTAPDTQLIDAFVSLGYVPGPNTLFRDVRKVEPGTYLAISRGSVEVKHYWRLSSVQPLECDYDYARDRFVELFAKTCERHLISDVPLGVFLSGGVDSSLIVAFVREELGRPLATFSVGYQDDPASSELGHAARVASRFRTDHHEFILTRDDFFQGIDSLLEHAEEPIIESAGVALMALARSASKHATVFLSGEGADEVFAGYDLYRRTFQLDRLRQILFPLRWGLLRLAISRFVTKEKLVKYLDWVGMPFEDRYRTIPADVTPLIRRQMYQDYVGDAVSPIFRAMFDDVQHRDRLAQMQYVDIKTWLVDDLLLKADKMTMAASVELRVPFLDHSVVEFGFSLPAPYKQRNGIGKAILKDILADYLPDDLVYREKQGFPVPISKWFRAGLYQPLRSTLLSKRFLERGYFCPRYIERSLERHRSGQEDLGQRLFSLLVLERWHQKWFDVHA
jgi:asparagine synthase (glutamine-hydrolysing)